MSDLINREEVLSKAFCAGLEDAQGNFYGSGHIVLADDVLKAPTVDAVEVVRCGKCKHYEFTWRNDNGDAFGNCKASGMVDLKNDFFCACGKRKDGNG